MLKTSGVVYFILKHALAEVQKKQKTWNLERVFIPKKILMSICYVPGIELDAVDTVRKKTQPLPY